MEDTQKSQGKERFIMVLDEKAGVGNEGIAMLQALYSRSSESVREHLAVVKEKGTTKFMSMWYVGYNHGSIGDCGTVDIFIENVSILVAKAIQDSKLYNGQETSTRYIDMSQQPIIDPLNTPLSQTILKEWMEFYNSSQEEMCSYLMTVYPIEEGQKEKSYLKAIKARAFDVLRAFLPAGICTQLSWHTSLRQAAERLALLRYHPLQEVREVAEEILTQLKKDYSASFERKEYEDQEEYWKGMVKRRTYHHDPNCPTFSYKHTIKAEDLVEFADDIAMRPVKTNLPVWMEELGAFTFEFMMDFGSARDLQRHRNGIFRMPLLTTDLGFHEWYLAELSPALREKALLLIATQTARLNELKAEPEMLQYYIPLGFKVSCKVTYTIPQVVYVAELRSGKTVHPTCRIPAQDMHRALKESFPNITLHSDMDKDDWDIKRGSHDITKVEK